MTEHGIDTAVAQIRGRAKKEAPEEIASSLAKLFPCLRNAHGIAPWKPEYLDSWAMSGEAGSGSTGIVRFILAVWSGSDCPWKVGAFKLSDLQTFDTHSLAIFQAWAQNPFWL